MNVQIVTEIAKLPALMIEDAPEWMRIDLDPKESSVETVGPIQAVQVSFPDTNEEIVEYASDWIWDHLRGNRRVSIAVEGKRVVPSEPDLAYAIARSSVCPFRDISRVEAHRLALLEELGIVIMSAGFLGGGRQAGEIGVFGQKTLSRLQADLKRTYSERALRRVEGIERGFDSLANDYSVPVALHEEMFRDYQLLRMHVRAGLYLH